MKNATDRRLSFVLTLVVERFGLGSWDPLFSRSRSKTVAHARQCAMAVMRDGFGMSTPEVGRLFDRDHTTVMYGCSVIRNTPEYREVLALVVDAFGPPSHGEQSTGEVGLIPRSSTDIRVTNSERGSS